MVTHLFMQNKNLRQIFLWPVVLGVFTIIGLVIALLEEGLIESISLLGLVIPVAVIIYFYCIKK
jgi:hypothetical protein